MKIQLRDYQEEAVRKIIWAASPEISGNSLAILPTGAGKSIVISEIASRLQKDILIIQPNGEILSQNYAKLCNYVSPNEIGIYSASMNEKIIRKYTFATIKSIYQKPEFFKHFSLIILDECHLLDPKNVDGMFSSFLRGIGSPKVIGLTATPFRLVTSSRPSPKNPKWWESYTVIKLINRMQGLFWTRLVFNLSISDLISEGHLVPLDYLTPQLVPSWRLKPNKSRSDYDLIAFENALKEHENKILEYLDYGIKNYNSTLFFASSVEQSNYFASKFPQARSIHAKTPTKERAGIITGFKNGSIKCVTNVGVLTTGFDHPALDYIVMARPTQSIGLYIQMLGRGVRPSPGKTNCKVVDLCGNVERMGKIESITIKKNEDNKWDLWTEKGYWHNRELYSHVVKPGK